MSTFPDRAKALRGVLTARRSPLDGGWPHRLDLDNAATSITSTAHAIEILRVFKYEFRDPAVQGGLAYLARTVADHTRAKKVDGPGRGATARYPAFALWGLSRYPQAPFVKELEEGFAFSLKWLANNRLEGGGWAMRREGPFSLTVTMPVVHALDRLAHHPQYGRFAEALRAEARRRVAREHRGAKTTPWWTPYGDRGKPSGAATAMAVLTLAGGGDKERELARNAITWLLNHPQEWVNRCETDTSVENRAWQMLSFSLGLRAVLHPCAKESPDTEILRMAIEHWDDLWVEEAGAWTHIPGDVPSTTGSFGVIVAARALKQAFEFDPATHVLGTKKRRKGKKSIPHPRPPLTLTLCRPSRRIHVVNQMGETMVEEEIRGPAQWRMLEMVAQRHLEGEDSRDQSRQTITLTALAKKSGSSTAACAKAIDRLNALLKDKAEKRHNQFLPSLIEDIDPSGGGEGGLGFDRVDAIVFEDEAD